VNLLLQIIALGVGVNLYGPLAGKVLDGINNLLQWAALPALATIITIGTIPVRYRYTHEPLQST
jgi:hypothetical protein